jgi:ketosteroid isomerase-like protein
MPNNIEVVARIYEAFGRGDVPAILEQLSDEVAWESWSDNTAQRAGVPWMQPRPGKAAVQEFFASLASLEFHEFTVVSIVGSGSQVAAEIVVDATPAGGTRFRDEEVHLWNFDDASKVTRFRHYLDTAKHIAAVSGLRADSGHA